MKFPGGGIADLVNDSETESSSDAAEGSESGNDGVSTEGSGTGEGTEPTEGSETGEGTEPTEGSGTGEGTESTEEGLKPEEGVGANEDPDAEKNENEANIDEDSEDATLLENVAEANAYEADYVDEESQFPSQPKDVSGSVGNISWSIDEYNRFKIFGDGGYLRNGEYPPWAEYAETIIGIYYINLHDIEYTKNMFYGFANLTNFTAKGFKNFDTSETLDMEGMFSGCSALKSLDLSNLVTNKVENMKNMFSDCSALSVLDLSGFETGNVKDNGMEGMFSGCDSLTSLDISGFDTGKVTSMENMFSGCSALPSLNVSGFDTGKVTSMENMFSDCSSLKSFDISRFDTGKVTSMENMFSGCSGLTSLDISRFDTGKVTSMENMFNGCSSLTSLDLSGFDTRNVTSMGNLFSGCSSLTSLDLSSFDMGNVVNVNNFISDCSGLSYICTPKNCTIDIELPGGSWYGEDGEEYSRIPAGLSDSIVLYKGGYPGDGTGLTKQLLFISGITVESKVYDGEPAAYTETAVVVDSEGNEITGISLSASYSGLMANGSNYDNIEDAPSWAGNYTLSYEVTGLDTDRYILPKTSFDFRIKRRDVTVTAPSFRIGTGEAPNFDDQTCEVSGLLENDTLITKPELRCNLDYTDTEHKYIKSGLYEIIPYGAEVDGLVADNYTIIYVSGILVVGESIPEDYMNLIEWGTYRDISWKVDRSGKLTLWGDGDYTDQDYEYKTTFTYVRNDAMTPWINSHTRDNIVSAEVNISNIKHTQFMFYGCKNLKSVDLSGLDTSNVVNMSYMFAGCSSLESLDVSGFDTSNVRYMNAMFANCSSLKSIDLSNFDTSKVSVMGDIFYYESPALEGNPEFPTGKDIRHKVWERMNGMFMGCSSLESLDLSNFDTSKVKRMGGMFCGCSSLKTLDLGNFDTSLVKDMQYMFTGCSSLTNLDVSNFDTGNVATHDSFDAGYGGMEYMFAGCSSLTSLDVSNFNTSGVEGMEYMFAGCSNLTSLDVSGFDTKCVDRMEGMFAGCSNLKSLDLSNFDASALYDPIEGSIWEGMNDMFLKCSSLVLIFTPRNNKYSSTLPGEAEDIWTSKDGTKYSELPLGLSNSIVLYKNAYSEEEGTLTKKIVYISGISVSDKTYDGKADPYTGTAVVKDSEGKIVSGINLNYNYAGTLENGTAYVGTAEEPPTQAGAYVLNIEMSGADADKYIFYKNSYGFCIKQKEIRITAPSIGIEVGGDVPELSSLTCEVNGEVEEGELPEGELLATSPLLRYSLDGRTISNSKPGKYLVIPYGAVLNKALTNNYRIKYENGTLTVGDADDNSPYDYAGRIDLSGQELKAVISNIKAKTYNGYAHEPTVKVTVLENGKKKVLTEGMDYRLDYRNNVNAGTGTVIVKGRGEYKGELTKEFTINPKSVKKLKYIIGSMSVGDDSTNPHIYVYDGPKLLQKGTDYTLSGTENFNGQPSKGVTITVNGTAGTASSCAGSGNESVTANYKDSKKIKIVVYDAEASKIIKPADIYWGVNNTSQTSLLSADYSQPYTGKAIKPDVTIVTGGKVLTKNKEYKIQYRNNKNAGTAYVIITGKGEYKGKVAATFEITPLNISDEAQKLEIKPIANKTYNGKLQKPSVKVKAGGKTLKKNKDYTLSYENNIHASTGNSKAEVIVTGKGNYSGMAKQTFTIKQQAIKKVSVKGTYDKGLTVTYGNRKLTEGIHYTLRYGEENKNKISVKITAKTGSDFSGSVTKKVKIK